MKAGSAHLFFILNSSGPNISAYDYVCDIVTCTGNNSASKQEEAEYWRIQSNKYSKIWRKIVGIIVDMTVLNINQVDPHPTHPIP